MIIDFITSEEKVLYHDAVKKMDSIVDDVIRGRRNSTVWFLEHYSVYTDGLMGKNNVNYITVAGEKIPLIKTNRGGQITFHGPGQLIIYFMLDLKKLYTTPDIKIFLNDIHNLVIETLRHFKIESFRDEKYPGVWGRSDNKLKKIAAIGMKIRKWVSFHGIAININPDMIYFDAITPCGIIEENRGVISMSKLLGGNIINKNEVIEVFKKIIKTLENAESFSYTTSNSTKTTCT